MQGNGLKVYGEDVLLLVILEIAAGSIPIEDAVSKYILMGILGGMVLIRAWFKKGRRKMGVE